MRALIGRLPGGLVVESSDGRVLLANGASCELLQTGCAPAALTGAPFAPLLQQLDARLASRLLDRTQPGTVQHVEVETDSGRTLAVSAFPLSDTAISRATLWTFDDITARKRTEAELHVSRQRLRDLAAHEEAVRNHERQAIARTLHDEVGQMLTAIKLELSAAAGALRLDRHPAPADVVDRLQAAMGLVDLSIATVQRVSAGMRPGVTGPLADMVRQEAALFEHRTKIRCRVAVAAKIRLDPDRTTAILRILGEALTNVARHAGAGAVRIAIRKKNGVLFVSVADNGRGILAEQIDNPHTLGLLGMRERALSIGGDVRITHRRSGGTVVTIIVPLPGPDRGETGEAAG